jgi:hypothetical protein
MEESSTRKEFCTIGPVPVPSLVDIMTQLHRQKWTVSHVAFAGMVSVTQKLSLARPETLPAYMIVAEKDFESFETFKAPEILTGGTK